MQSISQRPSRIRPPIPIKLLLLLGACLSLVVSSLWIVNKSDTHGRLMANEDVTNTPQSLILSTTRYNAVNSQAINFRLQPNQFVDTMTDCFDDVDCRIYYLHYGKSGGSGIENRMFKVFPPYQDSFAGGSLLKRFQEKTSEYCHAKFSSYQVSCLDFVNTIVPTCMKETGLRAVILVSFREPIQRSLSHIHQMCNKYQRHRNRVTRRICARCDYERDRTFWDEQIQHFNQEYRELQLVTTTKIENTSILSVDSVDLTLLYERLFAATYHEAFRLQQKTNAEATNRCNFGFKSEMFRGLAPSSEVYRNLTLGIYA